MSASAARAVGLERGDRPVLVGVDDVDQVVGHLGLLGRRWAWRCRCRCPRYTCIESTDDDLDVAERAGRLAAPSADLPDAVGPTSARCRSTAATGGAQPAVTGMRVRWRGRGQHLDQLAPQAVRRGAGDRDVGEACRAAAARSAREVHELVLAGAAG